MEVGTVGPVENKLLFFGHVQSLVFGNGEVSESSHNFLDTMSTSTSYIRRRVSEAAVKG